MTLYGYWKEKTKDENNPAKKAEIIIKDILRFVPEYKSLSVGDDYQSLPEIAELVDRLYRMPAPRVTYSFLIQLLRAQPLGISEEGGIRASDAAKCLLIVESFLVRRAFSGREPTGLHAVFKGLWGKNGGNPEKLTADLQTRTIDFPSDEQLRRDILTKPFYGRRLDRYVLSELEIATHRTHPFSRKQLQEITVDHLAPQSLKGAWRNQFPDNGEERQLLLGLLGNLVPLSQADNSTKGAVDWNQACVRLKNETIYRTTREVLDKYATWGPKEIIERTEVLAELAVKRWPRPE